MLRSLLAAAVGAVVACATIVYSSLQWYSFAARSWDLSIFTQLAQDYAAGRAPLVSVKGAGYNLLGDHFHPLLVVLGPVYAAFPHAFTLLVVQDVLFAAAAAVLAFAAIPRVERTRGILLGLALGFSWGLQYAVDAQFHEIAFAVPLLAFALVAFLDERWMLAAALAAPLVFVKEDLGLTVAVLGGLIAWRGRRTLGVWLAVWGVGWFALATFVVLPLVNPSGRYAYGSQLGLASFFTGPERILAIGHTVLLLVAVMAVLGLRSPLALLLLPTLAWRFLSDNPGYWGPTWHYSAVLMPIAFAALLDGIRIAKEREGRWMPLAARFAPLVSIGVAVALLPTLPLWQVTAPAQFTSTRAAAARGALAAVPAGAVVESDVGLMSYLVDGHPLYWLGNRNPVPDYLVIDRQAGGTPSEWGDAKQVAERLHPRTHWTITFDRDGYQVARRS